MPKLIQQFIILVAILLPPISPSFAFVHAKIQVVVSFSILADLVKNVGGDRTSIITFVGPNSNIHIYEPTPHDVQKLKNAHIIFINGLNLEGFIDRLITTSDTKALRVEVGTNISPLVIENKRYGIEQHHHHSNIDPHAWQAIPNVKIYIKNIADAFCKIDPQSCSYYSKNAENYIQKLDETQAIIKTQIATIPKDKRTIIMSHDAFRYFAQEYGFTILFPQNAATKAEATATDVAKLIKQIKANRATALFVENISNPRLIKQISQETGLKIGGTLYSDALSNENGPAATYLDMIKYNVHTIVDAIMKFKTNNVK
ncbi:metal ABC transporter solute-binding protein, Zn/Mn family [Bartonella sp. B41]